MKKVNRFTVVALLFSLSLVGLVFASSAQADAWDRKTTVTFSAPIEVPGVGAQILPAGTYVFKIFDSMADRHIVQIFSEDETHLYTTIIAIPNYRLRTTDKTVMTFGERAAGEPQAIRAWFYPGRNWGEEFVYPKKRALELSRVVNQPVLATPVELAPTAPVETFKKAPIVAVTPRGEEVAVAEVVEAPPVETARLPQTASPLPLLALMGLLSLGVGFTLLALPKLKRNLN